MSDQKMTFVSNVVIAAKESSGRNDTVQLFKTEEAIPFDYTVLHFIGLPDGNAREAPMETEEEKKERIQRTLELKKKKTDSLETKEWIKNGSMKTMNNYFTKKTE
jgi:hypothetical protein